MYAQVKELPECLQSALASVGYGRKDIKVDIAEEASLFVGGGNGYRGFAIVVDLSTGARQTLWGSWGGSNAFTPNNRVDSDSKSRVLGPNVAVIKGSEGGGKPVYATLTIGPANVVKGLLTAPPTDLTPNERATLYAFCHYKSSYRREAMERARIPVNTIDALIVKGLLVRKGNGVQATIEGKNADATLPRPAGML